jgi:hypothetical protein
MIAWWAGITAQVRTKTNALLCTLDVRQIRSRLLGKREAPGMESNQEIVGAGIPIG